MSRTQSKGWDVIVLIDADGDIEETHVVPVDDLVEHDEDEDCICGPAPELCEHGVWMYVHESLDRREDDE
jgi:hypothetical protein